MDKVPDLRGRSHGGDGVNSQVRRQALKNSADFLLSGSRDTENEEIESTLEHEKSCSTHGPSGKGLFNYMTLRSFTYWFACSVAAFIAVGVTEEGMAAMLDFNLPEAGTSGVLPVPEPSRAFLLFAGIMAMAFTYRRAWLSWRPSSQS